MSDFRVRMPELFMMKHGPAAQMGWAPRLRHRMGYFNPDDYYEALVESLVDSATEWIDVGGGDTLFPSNPRLAGILAGRCKRLVAVDPSSNVNANRYAHERRQCMLEDFNEQRQFTLATARMVVEHVTDPERFVAKLAQLVAPTGKAVVYTVSRWAPMTILSGWTPIGLHHVIKRVLWATEEKDTFPVVYRMNTRRELKDLFTRAGFRETGFFRLDDCRTLARWMMTSRCELMTWKLLRSFGLGYPESCLLAVYKRV